LDTENVVVDREHVHGRGWNQRWESNRDLSVVNAREVARASWLVFFWLEGEGVRVHTRVWVTAVVVVRLHLVEVLTLLGLETVLAVEDQLEVSHWANTLFIEVSSGGIRVEEWHTTRLADWHIAVGGGTRAGIAFEDDVNRRWGRGEVPQRSGNVTRRWVVKAPDKFLDWVVVGQTLVGGGTRSHGVGASVLHLLDEVFVTLLREAATLLGVQVHVVRPHLEHSGIKVGGEGAGQIEVDANFVVLKGNQWQVQTWVAVEEEDQWQVHGVTSLGSSHLRPVSLLGLIQVKLGVQTPPALVVLVNALATDGQFSGSDRTLSDPAGIVASGGAGVRRSGLEFDVHVADQITVAGNSDGHAARVGGGTVNSLFDVFHREVGVTLVHRLEEGNLGVTGQVDVLSAISYELHETTGHCESFCTISRENNSGRNRT
jgi:hypothetical protein